MTGALRGARRRWGAQTGAASALAGVAVLLAGCGTGTQQLLARTHPAAEPAEATRCGSVGEDARSAGFAATRTLVLSDMLPTPRMTAARGTTLRVVSRFEGSTMLFPQAVPGSSVCEVSRRRMGDGAASVTFRLLSPGRVRFLSSYLHVTPLMDPALQGDVTITVPRG